MTQKFFSIIFVLCIHFSLHSANVVIQWNQATLTAIQHTNSPPTIAARALGIVNTAVYDAWAAYDNVAITTMLGGVLRQPVADQTEANKQEAISFAAYNVLLDLFPTQAAVFNSLMASLGYVPNLTPNTTTPSGIGNFVAINLLEFRHHDGSNQLGDEPGTPVPGTRYSDYTGYAPVNTSTTLNDPNRWQPLNVGGVDQKFVTPQWGFTIPFALTVGSEFRPEPPFFYPSKKYTKQAQQDINFSANLNDVTKSVASYWADGPGTVTPPGHWNLFAQFISERDHHTLDADVKMFFILNNALMDASISAWECKRFYDYIRPISAIHFLYNNEKIMAWAGPGLYSRAILGQNFVTYISPTPAFPEYVSGHSTFSSAAAIVLKLFTGSSHFGDFALIPAGSSPVEPGITPSVDVILSWETFQDAADEAGVSRRYGGIHFELGDLNGRKLGKKVGKTVFQKAVFFINGGNNC
jgi:hypothetical protein